jgi:hypothetical protein
MNKLFSAFILGGILIAASCSKSDDSPTPPPPPPPPPVDSTSTIDVRGIIKADQTWHKSRKYRLRGYVYVTDGAKITIEAGTTIISNKDSAGVLVIYRDATIVAEGTASSPIIFTSAETAPNPGDLGGVILVGQAKVNGNHSVLEGGVDPAFSSFGGTNDAHSSGSLKYVRIEYAGKAVNPGDEVNALSLYGVGSGTTIDYVEVVRGLDDGFEFFGGDVNCKHLIAYNCADDDFDMDDGFSGKIQFAISVKDPAFTDNKGTTGDLSNNFEVDNVNPANGFLWTRAPITSPTLSNFTAIGPNNAAGTSPDYGYGMRWRRGTKFILANSIVMGSQRVGLDIDDDSTASFYKSMTSSFFNSFLNAYGKPYQVDKEVSNPKILDSTQLATITQTTDSSVYYSSAATIMLTDPFNNANPNLKPLAGSPALSTATKFTRGKLTDAFFEKVNYIGALDATTDWTAGWAVWNK